jgi:hypothetical protein
MATSAGDNTVEERRGATPIRARSGPPPWRNGYTTIAGARAAVEGMKHLRGWTYSAGTHVGLGAA